MPFSLSCHHLLLLLTVSSGGARSFNTTSNPQLMDYDSSAAPPPPPPPRSVKFHVLPLWVAVGFLIPAVAAFFCWFAIKLRRRIHPEDSKHADVTVFSPILRLAEHLQELPEKLDAAAAASGGAGQSLPLAVIGRGGCGEVYKANLLVGNVRLAVAIKRIAQPAGAAAAAAARLCVEDSSLLECKTRQVRSEILTVGRMCHPNLVPLLAHMTRPNCHYLVYEFMENGSLHDAVNGAVTGRWRLGWAERYRIAVGIATGLEYLHVVHRPRVIHRDLKPANVLLDGDLTPRISDFGLAKIVAETMSNAELESRVAGTLGYIAPEYHQTMQFTAKSDIYSFGVILMVLVAGKFPTDEFFRTTEEMGMVDWIQKAMGSAEPQAVIDHTLLGNGFEKQMLLVLKIACFCTYSDPKVRPNSSEVRVMLSQIKHQF